MVPILMTNLTNGFSGIAIYTDLYYAMFDVLNTVFILAAFLILDQDVAFNTERYSNDDQDILQIKDSPNEEYDPNLNESYKDLLQKDIFSRKKLLKDKGIKMNIDGSTNNLADYTNYSRNTLMKKL